VVAKTNIELEESTIISLLNYVYNFFGEHLGDQRLAHALVLFFRNPLGNVPRLFKIESRSPTPANHQCVEYVP